MKPEKKLRNHFGGAENLEMQKKLFDVCTNETQITSKPLSLSELLLLTIEPIGPLAYQPSSLSTIEPINHQGNQPSSLLTIKPINHRAYQPLSLLTIKPIDH